MSLPLSGAPESGFNWAGSALTRKHWGRLVRLAYDKCSSLLWKVVTYGLKSFITLAPGDRFRSWQFQLTTGRLFNRRTRRRTFRWYRGERHFVVVVVIIIVVVLASMLGNVFFRHWRIGRNKPFELCNIYEWGRSNPWLTREYMTRLIIDKHYYICSEP